MNRWNIPMQLEQEVLERDRSCIYCGILFDSAGSAPRRARPSWEHIVNDARIVTRENIAICCIGCNASKGAKSLAMWLQSKYCERNAISERTIAAVAQAALARLQATVEPDEGPPTVSDVLQGEAPTGSSDA